MVYHSYHAQDLYSAYIAYNEVVFRPTMLSSLRCLVYHVSSGDGIEGAGSWCRRQAKGRGRFLGTWPCCSCRFVVGGVDGFLLGFVPPADSILQIHTHEGGTVQTAQVTKPLASPLIITAFPGQVSRV